MCYGILSNCEYITTYIGEKMIDKLSYKIDGLEADSISWQRRISGAAAVITVSKSVNLSVPSKLRAL